MDFTLDGETFLRHVHEHAWTTVSNTEDPWALSQTQGLRPHERMVWLECPDVPWRIRLFGNRPNASMWWVCAEMPREEDAFIRRSSHGQVWVPTDQIPGIDTLRHVPSINMAPFETFCKQVLVHALMTAPPAGPDLPTAAIINFEEGTLIFINPARTIPLPECARSVVARAPWKNSVLGGNFILLPAYSGVVYIPDTMHARLPLIEQTQAAVARGWAGCLDGVFSTDP